MERAVVAQLDRATGYELVGWGFESLRPHIAHCGVTPDFVEIRRECADGGHRGATRADFKAGWGCRGEEMRPVLFAFLFFGHHQGGAQTPWEEAWSFVRGVPVPIWVAVIGLGAAVLTPVLQHALTRSGARKEAKRVGRRVRADLLARVRAHCVALASLGNRSTVDVELWQAAHDALERRARDPEVIDALDGRYHEFMQAVHAESVAINLQRQRNDDGAATKRNVSDALAAYAPFARAPLTDG